jgi:hypothetical protein
MSEAGRSLLGAAVIAAIQIGAASGVAVIWQRTAGGWTEGAYIAYAFTFLVVLPVVGFAAGRHVAHKRALSILWAWPIGAANLVAFGAAHGLKDAGVGLAGILVGWAGVSLCDWLGGPY